MREYDEDDYNIRRAPVFRRVSILVGVIIAVPVMMWTTTIFVRSLVERPKTFRHLTLTEPPLTASLPPKPQAALRGPLALPPGDAPPRAASPTRPAETAPNAPAVASGEAAAATGKNASSEAVNPVQRDQLTATGPATGSMAWVGPIPLPRVRRSIRRSIRALSLVHL
jgi:hypothetical protein